MKTKLVFSLLLSFYFCLLFSQVPQGFTYQAIARDGSGNPITNQSLPVRITIQSDSLGGATFWIEEHSSVTTNNFGLFTLILGKGVKQTGSVASTFNSIDWRITPKFIRTQIFYSGWKDMGSSRLWSVPYSMVAGDLSGSVRKLEVAGETSNMEEALFEVKNKNGQTVFAVYNEGVRIYVDDGKAKGATKGGFAIGGFNTVKGAPQNFFVVNSDSIRAYVDTNSGKGATKGGFAIGGFNQVKGGTEEYFRVTRDSTRVYVNDGGAKGATKGGFAIGGFDQVKGGQDEYLRVTSDSVKVSKSLLIPRLTSYERDHLPFIPGEALIIFNTSEGCMQIFKNNVWSNIWCFNCAPDFLIQPVDNVICSGNNVNFFISATGTNLTYQWQQSTDNGNTWNNLSNGGTSPVYSGATSYSLKLSNVPVGFNNYKYRCFVSGPCPPSITSNAVILNVGSTPPVFTQQPANQILSKGCAASFSVASPGYAVTYKWQQSTDGGSTWSNISNGGTSPVFAGATTPTLSLTNVPWAYNNYKFRSIISNLCGTDAISTSATLTIAPASILTQPTNQSLTTGCTASFAITTPAGYVISYQWQASADGGSTWNNISNGGTSPVYSGVTTATLSLSNVPWSCNNNKYRCVVSSLCGPNEPSNAAILTITASSIVTQPANQQLTIGCLASFSIGTPAGYVVNYQWQSSADGGSTWGNISNGGTSPVFSGVTTATLSLSNVPLAFNNYKFRCVVNSMCGPNEISSAATLAINILPDITSQPVNKTVFAGYNIAFSIITSGSGYSYQWQESTNGGSTWMDLTNGGINPTYSGVTTLTLSLSKVPITFNNNKYRCKVSHYCRPDGISNAATLYVPTPDPVTDIDGNSYITVGVGSDIWMAENLKTTRYSDGTPIPFINNRTVWNTLTQTDKAYCWYNDNISNKNIYGALYTWAAATKGNPSVAQGVCPTGWHLPTSTEWVTLMDDVGGSGVAGGKLKEAGTAHWVSPNTGATNESSFTALPGGYHESVLADLPFFAIGNMAYWWSSSEYNATEVEFICCYDESAHVYWGPIVYNQIAMSVRCIKDSGK